MKKALDLKNPLSWYQYQKADPDTAIAMARAAK
jgi:hypothetical protein